MVKEGDLCWQIRGSSVSVDAFCQIAGGTVGLYIENSYMLLASFVL